VGPDHRRDLEALGDVPPSGLAESTRLVGI
jgi:hypothetical protein